MSMKSYRGHNGDVFAVAIYQDKLISAGYDRLIRIFDLSSCELIRKIGGHIDLIRTIDICGANPKRPLIVSGSWDRTIRVWEMETGQCLQILTGHTNRLKCVVVCELTTPCVILSGSDDTTMRAWDIDTGHQIAEYNGHSHCVLSIAASAQEDPIAASGSTDCIICVWQMISGHHIYNLKGHEAGVCALVFAKPPVDGSPPALISSSADSSVRVWSMQSGEQLHILKGHTFGIIALSMWQEKTVPYPYLMTCAQNGTLQIWDLHKLELKKTTKMKSSHLIAIAQKAGLDNIMAFGGAEAYLRAQRTEEIYNAADIVGSPASPGKRRDRSSRRRVPSKKISISRGGSMDSAGGSFDSFGSFNDDDSQCSPQNSFVFSPQSCAIHSNISFEGVVLPEVIHKNPSLKSEPETEPEELNDSIPVSPRAIASSAVAPTPLGETPTSPATSDRGDNKFGTDENHKVNTETVEDEADEVLSVCSFDARVIRSVVADVEKDMAPPSKVPSVAEDDSLIGVDVNMGMGDSADQDDEASVITEVEEDISVFVNTESVKNGNKARFSRAKNSNQSAKSRYSQVSTRSNWGDGGGSVNSLDGSLASSMASVESIPRIPSAKWKHRGRHGPVKSITKGLGVGSRQSELKKATAGFRQRELPRIIETSKPFILVTSIESQAYHAVVEQAPQPQIRRRRQMRNTPAIRHVPPSTIVSSPQSLPQLHPASHNGYQAYDMDSSLKTVDTDCAESVASDFLDVTVKPPSPVPAKYANSRRRHAR